jgi:hypothetical protein
MRFIYSLAQISKDVVNIPKGDLTAGPGGTTKTVLQLVFGFLGALAVFMVMYGAFRYVTSAGNPDGAAKARSTIIYSVVGLVVALVAFSIVSFVVGKAAP